MRLLLVEDEKALAEALCEVLKKEGYAVDCRYNGAEGLYEALTGIHDVIILDIMLPEVSGLKILKELREEKMTVPVLLLTAKSELSDKITGLDSGADDYLTKPFQTGELLARVRALSRRRSEIVDEILTFEDLNLDIKRNEITAAGSGVKLGIKEFQIMEMLMQNPKITTTKDQIIEKVWGYDSDAEYNSVEVYISFLRKKISFTGSAVKIKADRGFGYHLEA